MVATLQSLRFPYGADFGWSQTAAIAARLLLYILTPSYAEEHSVRANNLQTEGSAAGQSL